MIFYAFQQFHTYAFIQASKVGKGVKKKKKNNNNKNIAQRDQGICTNTEVWQFQD